MYSSDPAYKVITDNLWSFEKRQAERFHSSSFQNSMDVWNRGKFNNSWKVGAVLEFLNKTQPADRVEFAKAYLNEVRSPSQVVKMVEEFAGVAGLTIELALNWWWIRVLDMSFTGWKEEKQICAMVKVLLAGTGNDVRVATDYEDRNYGVDLIVFNIETGKPVEGLQTKPASYFAGRSASNIQAREIDNPKKYKKLKEVMGIGVRYVVTDDSLRYGYPIFQNTFNSFKTSNRFGRLSERR